MRSICARAWPLCALLATGTPSFDIQRPCLACCTEMFHPPHCDLRRCLSSPRILKQATSVERERFLPRSFHLDLPIGAAPGASNRRPHTERVQPVAITNRQHQQPRRRRRQQQQPIGNDDGHAGKQQQQQQSPPLRRHRRGSHCLREISIEPSPFTGHCPLARRRAWKSNCR